jgi:glycosyltransferase involved in cell wall biosynthesis
MKIGIDIRPLGFLNDVAGLYQYTFNLVSNLLAIDSHDEYALLSTIRGFCGDESIPDTVLRRFPGRLSKFLLETLTAPLELVMGRADLFHGPCFFVPRSLRSKLVVTIHDVMPFRHPEYLKAEWADSTKKSIHASIKRADCIIAVSRFTKCEIVELLQVPDDRIRVIYNGISPIFRPVRDQTKVEHIKTRYGVRGPYFLFVGTIEPKKNITTLICAWAALRASTRYQYPLVLVGKKGWYFEELQKEIQYRSDRKDIIFTDSITNDDLLYLYSGAEAFVMPSLFEGFGIPLIEAMACGTPVVTSNRTSLPEIAGDSALVVDPLDVRDIAGAMHMIVSDPSLRARLVQKGLERAKEFSWENTARETLNLYRELGGKGACEDLH